MYASPNALYVCIMQCLLVHKHRIGRLLDILKYCMHLYAFSIFPIIIV